VIQQSDQYKISPGPVIGYSLGKDTSKVNRYLSMDFVRANFPKDARFLWSAKPTDEKSNFFMLYAIKMQVVQIKPLLKVIK
jgi:SecD/SecF fusion protein